MPQLTPEEVADELKVSVSTIRKMLSAGEFAGCAYKTRQIGGVWRIDSDLLREWRAKRALAACRIEPRSPKSIAARNRRRP